VRTNRRRIAVALGTGGFLLLIASMLSPWRGFTKDPGFRGDPSPGIAGQFHPLAVFLAGMLGLLLLVEAVLLVRGRARRAFQAVATGFALALLTLLGVIASRVPATITGSFSSDPGANAHARPGPAFVLAGAAVLAGVVATWVAPAREPVARPARSARWYAALILFAAGLATLAVSLHLVTWRSYYTDGPQVTGPGLVVAALPDVMVGGLLAVASLLTVGEAQVVLRRLCTAWLVITAVACLGLTGLVWALESGDALAQERGLQSTRPGEGVLLGLLGFVLVPLAGALATRRQR
jgi:hypothetical protein